MHYGMKFMFVKNLPKVLKLSLVLVLYRTSDTTSLLIYIDWKKTI